MFICEDFNEGEEEKKKSIKFIMLVFIAMLVSLNEKYLNKKQNAILHT